MSMYIALNTAFDLLTGHHKGSLIAVLMIVLTYIIIRQKIMVYNYNVE